jgi:UDP-N-acetylmuramoyl-tripeptide--D-alanyl-D-alanine ligase
VIRLAEAARAIGARLVGPDAVATGVSSDTRAIGAGALFVALRGERFDGHAFVADALAAGAVAALVDEAASEAGLLPAGRTFLVVADTRQGLRALASWWRGRFAIPVIGIVGSNGKTTTKEMTAAIVREHFGAAQVLATTGNLNNDIGVPLTLLGLADRHRIAVVEMGMNHPGETAELAAIARPTIALVNNAQREHQEFMKSVAEVAAEHGSLFATLPDDGIAVVNADDAFADYWRRLAGARTVRDFGIASPAAVTATFRASAIDTELEIALPEGRVATRLGIPGRHNVMNALAAAAAASAAGVPPAAIGRGLAAFAPAKGRLQVKRAAGGATVIDDTYNANPDSVRAAIDVLADTRAAQTVLVLGDMGEVGDAGPAFHHEVGEYARTRAIGRLVCLGDATRASVAAFGAGGRHCDSVDAVLAALADLPADAAVLVKGSRFMKMERVVEALVRSKGAAACC